MSDDHTPEPAQPKDTQCVSAFGAFAVLLTILALPALYAWLTTFPIEGDTPIRAEVIRNLGLPLAAIIGIGLAIWRGLQTDRQIKQTDKSLEAIAKQTEMAGDQLLLAQKASDKALDDADRETFAKAAELIANEAPATRAAGYQLMITLADRDGPFKTDASALLLQHFSGKKRIDGDNVADTTLTDWIAGRNMNLHFRDKTITNFTVSLFDVARHWAFRDCILKDCYIDISHTLSMENCTIENVQVWDTSIEIKKSVISDIFITDSLTEDSIIDFSIQCVDCIVEKIKNKQLQFFGFKNCYHNIVGLDDVEGLQYRDFQKHGWPPDLPTDMPKPILRPMPKGL